jgi:putative membrane protein
VKSAAYIGGLLGLTLLTVVLVRTDLGMTLHTAALAGGKLLWLAPYRLSVLLLFALGWAALLRPYETGARLGLGYVFWVTTVREAIDRLLPVASVGGAVAGVRLMHRRGIAIVPASTTVIVEILLTLIAVYLFSALGLLLLIGFAHDGASYRYLLPGLLLSLPIPAATAVLLLYGSVFTRLEVLLRRIVGINLLSEEAAALDREIKACLRRVFSVAFAGALQLVALLAGSLEIWFVLRVVGHPVGVGSAVIMESLMQALRHLAFVVPAGIGVQEAGLVAFGQVLGVSSELALTVSLAKRLREVVCGVPALISWVVVEGRWLRRSVVLPRS